MGWEVSTLIIKTTVKELIYDYTNINFIKHVKICLSTLFNP